MDWLPRVDSSLEHRALSRGRYGLTTPARVVWLSGEAAEKAATTCVMDMLPPSLHRCARRAGRASGLRVDLAPTVGRCARQTSSPRAPNKIVRSLPAAASERPYQVWMGLSTCLLHAKPTRSLHVQRDSALGSILMPASRCVRDSRRAAFGRRPRSAQTWPLTHSRVKRTLRGPLRTGLNDDEHQTPGRRRTAHRHCAISPTPKLASPRCGALAECSRAACAGETPGHRWPGLQTNSLSLSRKCFSSLIQKATRLDALFASRADCLAHGNHHGARGIGAWTATSAR